jgi:hypothetical protein
MWGAVSDKRTGLSFTTAAGLREHSHSQVRVPRDSRPRFTASDSRLLQPGGPSSRIYIPQEQGRLVMSPSTGFSFVLFYDPQGYSVLSVLSLSFSYDRRSVGQSLLE